MKLILPAIADLVFANDNPRGVAGRINSCMKGLVSGSAVVVMPVGGRGINRPWARRAWGSVGGRGRAWMDRVGDEVLVKRMASGDEGALSDLYDRYAGLVYGTGVRLLGDRETAEELVQDVFISVWMNAGGFDPARARFATWLYRITRNRATDLIRRRNARVRAVGTESLLEPGESDPSDALSRRFDVAAALTRLSPVHRELLVLAYFQGFSQREISERTNTPLGTVKSRTSAALRALRETMSFDEDRWSADE
jgi:RNA polymerase sigma-70 factor, ECF subfamily